MARRSRKLGIDGSVPGLEYNRLHGGHGSSQLDGQPQIDLPHPHADYHPPPGHMDIPEPDYDGYTAIAAQSRMPELRLDRVARPSVQDLSLYDLGALTFAARDQQQLDMYDQSHPDRLAIGATSTESDDTDQARPSLGPLTASHEISLEMEIAKAGMPDAKSSGALEQILEIGFQPAPMAEMAGEFQLQQEMYPPAEMIEPPQPSPQESAQQLFDEQMQQFMNGFGMPMM